MRKIRSGDTVLVTSGRNKGQQGTVRINLIEKNRVVIEGVNIVKKHTRPNPMKGQTGGIVEKSMPIDQSNVMLFNPATGKGDRVGVRVLEDGTKVRFFKSNGEQVKA